MKSQRCFACQSKPLGTGQTKGGSLASGCRMVIVDSETVTSRDSLEKMISMSRPWTPDDVSQLVLLYEQGVAPLDIAGSLNRSRSSVIAKKHSLLMPSTHKRNPKILREGVFSSRSPETAYWAGFLMADGHVSPNLREVVLRLSSKDIDHLEAFGEFVGFKNGIRAKTPIASLKMTSSSMAADLQPWGVVPQKTTVGKIPSDIDEDLLPHFVRGLIDGDGNIYTRTKPYRRCTISLAGNRAVVGRVGEILEHNGISCHLYLQSVNPLTGFETCRLAVGSKKDVCRAIRWLRYDDPSQPSLERKRKLALDVIDPKRQEVP